MANVEAFYANVVAPAELRFSQAGKAWLSCRLAENRKPKNGGEETTTWWTLKAFGTLAEDLADALASKGARIKVRGRLELEEWTGRDGNARTTLTVTPWEASDVEVQEPRSGFTSGPPAAQGDPWAAPSTGGGDSEEAPRGRANATAPYSAPTGDVWGARNTTDEFVNTNRGSDRPF